MSKPIASGRPKKDDKKDNKKKKEEPKPEPKKTVKKKKAPEPPKPVVASIPFTGWGNIEL